jgi:hypothetical protein
MAHESNAQFRYAKSGRRTIQLCLNNLRSRHRRHEKAALRGAHESNFDDAKTAAEQSVFQGHKERDFKMIFC